MCNSQYRNKFVYEIWIEPLIFIVIKIKNVICVRTTIKIDESKGDTKSM